VTLAAAKIFRNVDAAGRADSVDGRKPEISEVLRAHNVGYELFNKHTGWAVVVG